MAYGRRNTSEGPWHYCARCDKKKLINIEMSWQLGLLLCDECIDDPNLGLIGQREIVMANVLTDGKEELAPVQKLRDPDLQDAEDDLAFM